MAKVDTDKSAELLVARTWFITDVGDSRRVVRQGMIVAANDPVVKGREDLFGPASEQLGVTDQSVPLVQVPRDRFIA